MITILMIKVLPVFARLLAGSLLGDHSLLVEIYLIATKHNLRAGKEGVCLQLLQPISNVEKRFFVCQIEQDQKAHGIAEEGGGQRTKSTKKKTINLGPMKGRRQQFSPLLAGSVPDLQLAPLAPSGHSILR